MNEATLFDGMRSTLKEAMQPLLGLQGAVANELGGSYD